MSSFFNASTIDLTIIMTYLAITLMVGIWFGQNVKSLKEYSIGDNGFSTTVLVFTIIATWIGGGSMLGTSNNAFKYGIVALYPQLGMSLCLYIISSYLAPRMKPFLGMISVGEMIGDMYGREARIITGIAGAVKSLGHVGVQIFVMGNMFSYLTPGSKTECMLISTLVIIIYSALGGVRSVTFTDVLQSLTVAIAVPTIVIVCLKTVGGYDALLSKLPSTHTEIFYDKDLLTRYTYLFVYFCIPFLTPAMTQRMLMARDTYQIATSFKISAVLSLFFYSFAVFIGLIAFALSPQIESNHTLMYLVDYAIPPVLKGIAICGILSVIMSTADSHLNVASVSLTNDYLKLFIHNLSDSAALSISRALTVVFGIFAYMIASKFTNLLDLVLYVDNFWGPIVVTPLLLGLCGFRSTSKVFIISAVAGFSTFIFWEYFRLIEKTNIYSIIASVTVNGFTFLLAHYGLKQPGGWITRQPKAKYQ
jgi:Na+/proline symporter